MWSPGTVPGRTRTMSEDEREDSGGDHSTAPEGVGTGLTEAYVSLLERVIKGLELAAATIFLLLFAIGVLDLALQIVGSVRSGSITDPLVVVGFIDTGLLLLIIVEVYETVLAYIQENETRRIVQLIIYTGVIAMVRKAIIFRTAEYPTAQDALFAAVAYTILIFGLIGLLFVERVYGKTLAPRTD